MRKLLSYFKFLLYKNGKLSTGFYHRISVIILLFSGLLSYNIIYNLDSFSGIGIYNGLFNITTHCKVLTDISVNTNILSSVTKFSFIPSSKENIFSINLSTFRLIFMTSFIIVILIDHYIIKHSKNLLIKKYYFKFNTISYFSKIIIIFIFSIIIFTVLNFFGITFNIINLNFLDLINNMSESNSDNNSSSSYGLGKSSFLGLFFLLKKVKVWVLIIVTLILIFFMSDGISLLYYINYLSIFIFFMLLISIVISGIILYLFNIIEKKGNILIPNSLPNIFKRFINYLVQISKNKELFNYYKEWCKSELVFYLIILILYSLYYVFI